MALKAGQTVRLGTALYRVDHVNASRAYLLPLAKRHVVLADGSDFDSYDRRGISVSPDSFLEEVHDSARARDEIELQEAESEIKALKAKLAEEERINKRAAQAKAGRLAREAKAVVAKPEAATKPQATTKPEALATGRSKHTWCMAPGRGEKYEAGSLKEEVTTFLASHPGAGTAEVAAACHGTAGAVTACLDRFWKAGVVIKE